MLIPIVMKVSIIVNEAGNFVTAGDRSPAVVDALAGKGEVQTEIDVGVRFRVVGGFRKPWAGDHDAGGIDGAGFECLKSGGVHGVRFSDVIGVDDEQLGILGVAKFFSESLGD